MRFAFLSAAIFAALLLFGCGVNLEQAVVGRYRAEVDLSGVSAEKKEMAQMVSSMASNAMIQVKENHSVVVELIGNKIEGTWRIDNGLLHVQPSGGRSVPAQFTKFRIEEGGKRLEPDLSAEDLDKLQGMRISFKKE